MPIDPIMKAILDNQKQINLIQKELRDLKKIIKNIDSKINIVHDKIQEFEVVFDAAEIIEDELERQQEYNTEWNPYDDGDFEPEDYENYDDNDGDDIIHGY